MSSQDDQVHACSIEQVLEPLAVRPEQGLSDQEVRARREKYGLNRLREAHRRSVWAILLEQFKSVVILVLVAAMVVAFVTQRWPEAFALVAVIVVNTLIGFFSEWRAIRSMEALRRLAKRRAHVRRQGHERQVNVEALVPGDIVLLSMGDLIPADLRVVEAENLRVNEAALTGESVPANKRTEPVKAETPLAERSNMLYKGATVADGSAVGVVTATGMDTELGRISQLAEEAEETATPLERRLDRLGRRMAWIVLSIAAVLALVGLLARQQPTLIVETAIALGVAAVPEGLPIVATIALARGMWLMARRNALINRLTAVETLGATRVIFTDKTGTLTENQMTLQRVITPAGDQILESHKDEPAQAGEIDEPLFHRLLEIAVLCNGAALGEHDSDPSKGDPTEIALLEAGRSFKLDRNQLLDKHPEEKEVSFDPEVMMMATYHQRGEALQVAVKGAPGAVLKVCDAIAAPEGEKQPLTDEQRKEWLNRSEELAREGLRLLALADKTVDDTSAEPYEKLCFVGLVGLLDPPRRDVRDAIAECQKAGIRVVMVTGDQLETGRAIAKQVGIAEEEDALAIPGTQLADPEHLSEEDRKQVFRATVFARVSPEQKLNLVTLFQEHGETVAMTGDGVNDAPALKKADIGVAMGQRGTDAARQVSDMILRDDNFSSIVAAVEQGRIIFANIRKSVIFMLCTNFAEILVVALATLASAPLPLRPLQILFLNMLTDVFPALALGVGKGSPQVMNQPPRHPSEAVLTRHHWFVIGGWSGLIGACVLTALTLALLWLGLPQLQAVTVSFLTLAFSKLWFVFNLRDRRANVLNNDVTRNPWIWAALLLCVTLLLVAVYWSPLAAVLETESPGGQGWLLVLVLSLIPAVAGLFLPAIRSHARPLPQQG